MDSPRLRQTSERIAQTTCVSCEDTGFAALTDWRQTAEHDVGIRQAHA